MAGRVLLILGVFLALGALGAPAGASTTTTIPDLYSGSWPAKLMPSNEALGTITWIPVSEEWGRGVLGQPFGGAPFTNCPPPGQTRFFLGRYGTGGKLIGCTVGADGKTLHGRYDGAGGEFRPGSFDVSIVTPDDPETFREFFGVYVEDGGITTNWCGELIESSTPDVTPPSIAALPSLARAARAIPLRFSASDDRGLVRVSLTVTRAGRLIGAVSSPLRRFGEPALAAGPAPAPAAARQLLVLRPCLGRLRQRERPELLDPSHPLASTCAHPRDPEGVVLEATP